MKLTMPRGACKRCKYCRIIDNKHWTCTWGYLALAAYYDINKIKNKADFNHNWYTSEDALCKNFELSLRPIVNRLIND